MPELAEVRYYSRQWNPGLGQVVSGIHLHPRARIFRRTQPHRLSGWLTGQKLTGIETHGKIMLFRFAGRAWLTVHLGMSGSLSSRRPGSAQAPHEHLVLHFAQTDLVLTDPRMFGEVQAGEGSEPAAWSDLPPQPTDRRFTTARVRALLQKHPRSPVKAVLLMQEAFPGVGNWMADEILWRSALHPARQAGSLTADESKTLHHETVKVCRDALRVIGRSWGTPPDTWLFNHRWKEGGHCPLTGAPLARATIAGRTTCWSPARQPAGRSDRRT
ncbi:MAG: DNA-formamidopyrimidine glycosylase family protein [Candidatus Methylacidiphilales bacterium]|nr:DNA-formamidopyrimidine glycosylase family protein [Candidatus Methylacidiphilales bacterium]